MAIDKPRVTVPSTIERRRVRALRILLSSSEPPLASIKIDPETGEVFTISQEALHPGQLVAVQADGGFGTAELWCVIAVPGTGGIDGLFWKRVALTRPFDTGTNKLWDPRANFYTSLAT